MKNWPTRWGRRAMRLWDNLVLACEDSWDSIWRALLRPASRRNRPRSIGLIMEELERRELLAISVTAHGITLAEGGDCGTYDMADFSHGIMDSPSDYSASIAWGDGTTTAGTVNSFFQVNGHHAYAEVGNYTMTITVTGLGDSGSGSATMGVSVDGSLIASPGANAAASAAVNSGTMTVATFTDANTLGTAGDFTATIDWGDGGMMGPPDTSAGTVVGGAGQFNVQGSHMYVAPGTYSVHISITDDDGATASTTLSLPVSGGPTPMPVSHECNCGNVNEPGDVVTVPKQTSGATPAATSAAPVRYADGVVQLAETDLYTAGLGSHPWGQTRSWTNGPAYAAGTVLGNGWVITQLPHLMQADGSSNNTIVAVSNGLDARYYDLVSGSYQARFADPSQLSDNSMSGLFTLSDGTGGLLTFYDFSSAWPAAQRGQFQSYTDPYGNVTAVTSHTSAGLEAEVQRSATVGGVTTTESYLYAYLAGPDVNAGRLASVTQRRQVGGGSWTTIQKVAYAYYNGTESHGNLGDLKTATVEDASGNVLDVSYYRYYVSESGGYQGGLKYVFNPDSYRRLVAALGTGLASLTDAQVAPYADNYFQYDSSQRVTEEIAAGFGSSANAGLGTYTFSYTRSNNAPGPNSWSMKTVVGLPNGTQQTVYTNIAGRVMLDVLTDPATSQSWDTFYEYDSSYRVFLEAAPSAVTGYNDGYADLLDNVSGNYQYLSDSSGLIQTFDFYATTTATGTTAGGAAGLLQDRAIRQGETGTAVPQEGWTYFAQTGGSLVVFPVAADTVYRNTDGTGAETTSYAYTWFTATAGEQSVTVTAPTVTSAENGPGTADVETTYFNSFGDAVWHQDADGFLTYTAYDPATDAVVKTIDDVDTARTGDFTGLPSGWSTPSGGGLHLVTQYTVDALGRTTKEVSPAGNVTYTVYNDPNHEERIYAGWNVSTGSPTLPTEVVRADLTGTYTEDLSMVAVPHLTGGVPDGTEAVGSVLTLSRVYVNSGGQAVESDDYFYLTGLTYSTAAGLGTAGTNYYATLTGYDAAGDVNRVQHPTGTIDRTVRDGEERVVSTWVGTNDTPTSGTWSPTNNTGSANMVQVSGLVYDNGGVGDGNLTKETDYPGGSAAPRETDYFYDWRDRLVASKAGVQASEDTTTHRPISYVTYDNLDEQTQVQTYDGDGVTISTVSGVPQAPSSSLLRSQVAMSYDEQGRVYQTRVYSVDPGSGVVSSTALTTNAYYDHRGDLIATSAPGGLWAKEQYDGAGRVTVTYTTDGGSGTSWSAAGSVSGDIVLSEQQEQYDADGNVIETIDRERFHDATGTGPLGDPTTEPYARVYYAAAYYDNADRPTADVDVGTNGGTAWTRPTTAPASSATALVTLYVYTPAGELGTTTDPRGIQTTDLYDALGRVTETIVDNTDGIPTATSNQVTQYTYDGDDNLLTQTAVLPGGATQETQYVYGVTTAGGSDLNSNDLVAAVKYPDPSTGAPSSTYQETYTVNALGDTKTFTDRNGTVHTYSYDVLGRETADAITTLASGVDGSVRRIEMAYDTQGNAYLLTSYDSASGGSIVNQVLRQYNGLGQLTAEYQSHGGAVNTSTTPSVQYAYTAMAGGVNNSRIVSMTYPNGRVLNYNYASGLDSSISRLSSISDSSGTLESYTYLGLDTVVQRTYPQPGIALTYIKQAGEANGDAGDQYTGLDRFGRVVNQRWLSTSTGTATDWFAYGYDQDSNVLYRQNLVDAVFSELYHANGASNGYDNLNRLTAWAQGTLSDTNSDGVPDTVASPSASQSWTLDALGSWSGVTTNGTAQSNSFNQQDEQTAAGTSSLTHDANGNLTTDQTGHTLVYDAWDRLVQVKSGSTTLAAYAYDGLDRQVTVSSGGTTSDLYRTTAGQVIEERVGGSVRVQYVWSAAGGNLLVLRDRDPSGGGTLSERLYVQQDAAGNVTALVNTSGTVVERYTYTPYGTATYWTGSWVSLSGSAYGWVYLYQGGRYDLAAALYILGSWAYSATLGQWLGRAGAAAADPDPHVAAGDNPASSSAPVMTPPPPPPARPPMPNPALTPRLPPRQRPRDPNDILAWVEDRATRNMHAEANGEPTIPWTMDSLPVRGLKGNKTVAEAMATEAGPMIKKMMSWAMPPFYVTPVGPLAQAADLALELIEGNWRAAALSILFPVGVAGVWKGAKWLLRPAGQGPILVTTWVPKGVIPTFSQPRWVMVGGPTWWNFIRTGLWGPQMGRTKRIPFVKFWWGGWNNFSPHSRLVPPWLVRWPKGIGWWRGLFGQRIIPPCP